MFHTFYTMDFQARLNILREKTAMSTQRQNDVETKRAAFETLAGGEDGQSHARCLKAQVCQLEEELKRSYEEMESCLIRRVPENSLIAIKERDAYRKKCNNAVIRIRDLEARLITHRRNSRVKDAVCVELNLENDSLRTERDDAVAKVVSCLTKVYTHFSLNYHKLNLLFDARI